MGHTIVTIQLHFDFRRIRPHEHRIDYPRNIKNIVTMFRQVVRFVGQVIRAGPF
jgi:hypothetical protein